MNRDEIATLMNKSSGQAWGTEAHFQRFAALVAAAEQDKWMEKAHIMILGEREACAKVCETLGVHPALNVYAGGSEWYKHGKDLAAAIRARSNT